MSDNGRKSGERKIRLSVGFSPNTERLIDKEAARHGITFADQVRRITDNWADTVQERQVREKIVVMKEGVLIPTR